MWDLVATAARCHWQEMRLYLVWDSESISEQTDTVVEDLFKCVDGDGSSDSEEPRRKRRSKSSRKVKKESSGSNEASDSESDSEESNEAGKYPWEKHHQVNKN